MSDDDDSAARWTMLGVGGIASLCCLTAAGAAAGGAATGVVATLTSGLVRVAVTLLTLGLLGLAFWIWKG